MCLLCCLSTFSGFATALLNEIEFNRDHELPGNFHFVGWIDRSWKFVIFIIS